MKSKTKQFTNVNLDSDKYGSFRSLTKVEGVGNFPFGQLTEYRNSFIMKSMWECRKFFKSGVGWLGPRDIQNKPSSIAYLHGYRNFSQGVSMDNFFF